MIAFEGPEVILGILLEDLKAEINDLSRLGKLLPEGAVKDFTSNGDKCSFNPILSIKSVFAVKISFGC